MNTLRLAVVIVALLLGGCHTLGYWATHDPVADWPCQQAHDWPKAMTSP